MAMRSGMKTWPLVAAIAALRIDDTCGAAWTELGYAHKCLKNWDKAAKALLLAVPMQALNGFLAEHGPVLNGRPLVACAKGVDLTRLEGSTALMALHCPAWPIG